MKIRKCNRGLSEEIFGCGFEGFGKFLNQFNADVGCVFAFNFLNIFICNARKLGKFFLRKTLFQSVFFDIIS